MKNKLTTVKFWYIKISLLLLFTLITFKVSAPEAKVLSIFVTEPINIYDRLINAIIKVESKGNTLAFNPNEKATGALQIRPIRLIDYNRRTGSQYSRQDCFNLSVSKEIFLYYAMRIKYPNYELIARAWNGSGRSTLDYWKKVKINL
jgi:hypothetical protein